MRIQDQLNHANVNDENLAFYRAIGVDDLTVYPPPFGGSDGLQTRAEMTAYLKKVPLCQHRSWWAGRDHHGAPRAGCEDRTVV
jgi:hypothetical protein